MTIGNPREAISGTVNLTIDSFISWHHLKTLSSPVLKIPLRHSRIRSRVL